VEKGKRERCMRGLYVRILCLHISYLFFIHVFIYASHLCSLTSIFLHLLSYSYRFLASN
jgi:hypothetical protein